MIKIAISFGIAAIVITGYFSFDMRGTSAQYPPPLTPTPQAVVPRPQVPVSGIVPPRTGDAGLASKGSSGLPPEAGVIVPAALLLGGVAVLAKRRWA